MAYLQIEVSNILSQAGVTLSSLVSRTQDLVYKLKALQFDRQEFVCLKYLVLFNPGEFAPLDKLEAALQMKRCNLNVP